jgi:diadenosine tetraphosphatase ApaH/serine/threonine PP2A family protein phosphatase
MYATAAARSDGLLLLCGGRDAAGVPLADAHGFARHRDGRWEWHAAPGAMPSGRYQHGAVFVGARLHVSGGAVGGGRMVEESSSVVALDTSGGAWCLPPPAAAAAAASGGAAAAAGTTAAATAAAATAAAATAAAAAAAAAGSGGGAPEDPARRCRHAAASVGPFVFLYGGLRGSALLDDLLLADDGRGTELACCDPRSAAWSRYLTQAHGSASAAALLAEAAAAEAAAAEALRERRSSGSLGAVAEEGPAAGEAAASGTAAGTGGRAGAAGTTAAAAAAAAGAAVTPISTARGGAAAAAATPGEAATPTAVGAQAAAAGVDARDASPDGVTLLNHWRPPPPGGTPPTPDVRLYHRAVVAPMEPPLRGLVRQLSIDQLDNEGRRVSIYGEKGSPGGMAAFGGGSSGGGNENGMPARSPLFSRSLSVPGAHKRVINELLRPRQWRPNPEDRRFMLGAEEIVDLCEAAERLFADEPSVLELRAPVKIFGDLHGQFGDLMRLFEEYGAPNTAGDITYIDYLFLGDYVDRGSHSLETICLLLALKVEYPRHVHLIRGNHEAADINALFGFRLECLERLGDEDGIWVWKRVNALFNWLPLAALIEGKVLCMHGGIGRSIHRVEQIAELKRPLTMEDGGPVLMDLLWSDPTTNDGVEGVQPSPRGPGLVTFGPDRVKAFCRDNGLQMIVRAHECVMDGFERFAQGHLITLFSATNYCGTAGNAGAILVLGRDLVMVPKLIHPVPPATPRTPDSSGGGGGGGADALLADGEDGGEGGAAAAQAQAGADTWMTQVNEERPPTPPRGRPHSPGSSLEYF